MGRRMLIVVAGVCIAIAGRTTRAAEGNAGNGPEAAKPVVAVFKLTQPLTETPGQQDDLFSPPGVSLKEMVERMDKAAGDPSVKAVVVTVEGGGAGFAQIEELRQAMGRVRAAGKDVFAHTDSAMMGQYLLICGASRVSATPTADLWITGFYADQPYVRGLLDKIGVQPEFLTCGAYKSAAELFMRTGPSPQADEMHNWLYDSIYDTTVKLIAAGRNVSEEQARKWIDDGPYTAEKAKAAGIIDAVEHREQFVEAIKAKCGKNAAFDARYGQKKQEQIDLSSPFGLMKFFADIMGAGQKPRSTRDAVGVVYVDGMIMLGHAEPSPFGGSGAMSTDVRKALDQAAKDEHVKAVVLRIDSPGGSAVASEIILAATKEVKARKPLVVSMGDVAGSGGYYVACGSDVIFADESTITGSIGVVAGKLVTTDMWGNIGITFKPYQRGKNAGLLNSDRPWTPAERDRVQGWMNDIYDVFKQHVTDIRGPKLKKPLEDMAGGRVYTGRQALGLGLVDKIGTLHDAVAYAADQAKLKDYDVRVVPEPKNFLERLMEQATGAGDDEAGQVALPRPTHAGGSLVEMAMPYLQHLDPQRVRLVTLAIERLDLMRREGVVVVMPEVYGTK